MDASATTPSPGLADSLERLGTETAFSVLARARELERQGREIIHLEIGEPDFDTPLHIREAAAAALRAGETHYCPSAGIPELREEAARYLSGSRDIEVDPANVLVGTGAKPFLFFTDPRDLQSGRRGRLSRSRLPDLRVRDPLGRRHARAASAARGARLRIRPRGPRVAARPEDEARDPQLAAEPDGRGALARGDGESGGPARGELGAWILSDEVYSQMVYDGDFASVATHPGLLERTVLLDGLSKTYAMTGWRCGFAAVPEPLVDPLVRFFVNSTSCVPPFVQLAGVAALSGPQDEPRAMVEEFRARRGLVVEGLNALPGVSCRVPRGAFYAFPNVAEVPLETDVLADRLLEEAGVAVLAGSAFGRHGVDNLRISYANSRENLALALERIRDFLDRL